MKFENGERITLNLMTLPIQRCKASNKGKKVCGLVMSSFRFINH